MNYSEAARGPSTRSGKLFSIQSSFETEFGRKMTDGDIVDLKKVFTLNETYANIKKVTKYLC